MLGLMRLKAFQKVKDCLTKNLIVAQLSIIQSRKRKKRKMTTRQRVIMTMKSKLNQPLSTMVQDIP